MAAIDVGFPAIITQTQKTGKKNWKISEIYRDQLPQTASADRDSRH
jgi:hypothetical protein